MGTEKKQNISIKGTKEGLLFILNEECSFEDIINDLKEILEVSHQNILNGPVTKVTLKIGYRKLSEEQKNIIIEIFKTRANLIINSIDSEIEKMEKKLVSQVTMVTGIIRSGQISTHSGNILFIGDVHAGGTIEADGDIYIIGTLNGIAHAGKSGDNNSIVIASIMNPVQLKIGEFIRSYLHTENNQNLIAHVMNQQIFINDHQDVLKLDKFTSYNNNGNTN